MVAGGVFGLYIAHLLYYLNPQIDIGTTHLLAVSLLYALLCALIAGSLLWVLRLARRRWFPPAEPKPHGFGIITFSALFSAVFYWIHLATLRVYLPRASVRMLANATTIIGITAFLLFLLWLVERNASRRVSDLVFLIGCGLIGLSVFFLHQRREIYPIEHREAVVANVGPIAGERQIIVVSVRSLPFDWIVKISGETPLPWFDAMREGEYFARLEPFPTTSARAISASLATGKLPYRHGVTGRYSYRTAINGPGEEFLLLPNGLNFHTWGLIPPVQRVSIRLPSGRALPFWRLFSRLGFQTAVVNWPFTTDLRTPGTRVISDATVRKLASSAPRNEDVEEVEQRFTALPEHGRAIAVSALQSDLTALAVGREQIEKIHPALTVISLNGLGELDDQLETGGNELSPRSSAGGDAIRAYIEELDTLLGDLSRRFPAAHLYVVSSSGPNPRHIAADPLDFLELWLELDDPGSSDGFLLIRGQGVAHQENPPTSQVVDFVPTLLFGSGLPVARDMDGRVITEAFQDSVLRSTTFSLIPSYEADRLIVRRPEP